jgi:hypothetical protein
MLYLRMTNKRRRWMNWEQFNEMTYIHRKRSIFVRMAKLLIESSQLNQSFSIFNLQFSIFTFQFAMCNFHPLVIYSLLHLPYFIYELFVCSFDHHYNLLCHNWFEIRQEMKNEGMNNCLQLILWWNREVD